MNTLRFRWLGVTGIELSTDEQVLVIDPFVTRPPLATDVMGARSF